MRPGGRPPEIRNGNQPVLRSTFKILPTYIIGRNFNWDLFPYSVILTVSLYPNSIYLYTVSLKSSCVVRQPDSIRSLPRKSPFVFLISWSIIRKYNGIVRFNLVFKCLNIFSYFFDVKKFLQFFQFSKNRQIGGFTFEGLARTSKGTIFLNSRYQFLPNKAYLI